MLASNLQPTKNPSVGDLFRASPSPYSPKPSQEMGHVIREARKLPRNNTFISLEATKEDNNERVGNLKSSLPRWNSVENLNSDRQALERDFDKIAAAVTVQLEQFNNGSDSNDDDCSETKERNAADRRCSMIPLMSNSVGRPKAAQIIMDREKIVRKKPPLPPKVVLPVKNQDPIKMFRAERLQAKKLDLEQQLEEMREQYDRQELSRQKEEQRNRETIALLKQEISDLKSTCEKLMGSIEQLQNSDDLFAKIKHNGEFSFYARSYEVSKKIISNTFRRRKSNTARPSCLEPNAGASQDIEVPRYLNQGDHRCILNDTAGNSLGVLSLEGVSSGGDGDHHIRRANSAPEAPMNIMTSMYYVSKVQSVGMEGTSTPEACDNGE
uniref:Uncharacterized protein n=1 Tax=Anopheles christyi TaxID=43041 RepID=A0A182K4Z4_9DIPT